MSKCEWKDGKYKPCFNAKGFIFNNGFHLGILDYDNCNHEVHFCPLCGADIRKPVVEPIIKRSGETFVVRYDGVDYINIMDKKYIESIDHMKSDKYSFPMAIKGGQWEKIEGLEITDEIAKLRPIIAVEDCDYCSILIHVNEGTKYKYTVIESSGAVNRFISCELATVEDLED